MKIRSIKHQINHAVSERSAVGQKKHAASPDERRDKVYSNERLDTLRSTANQFADFLKTNFPEVRLVRDITGEHTAAWLESKKENWSLKTFGEHWSRLAKLEHLCDSTYGQCKDWRSVKVEPPERAHKVRDKTMTRQHYEMLRECLKNSRSPAKFALELSGRSGFRVEETACLRGKDINLEKNTVYISPEGAKNGRARTLNIFPRDMEFYKMLKEYASDGYVCKGIKSGSLDRTIRRHMEKLGISEGYPKTTLHSVRKMYAHERMTEIRGAAPLTDEKAEMKAFSIVSVELGHGENRPDLYETYAK